MFNNKIRKLMSLQLIVDASSAYIQNQLPSDILDQFIKDELPVLRENSNSFYSECHFDVRDLSIKPEDFRNFFEAFIKPGLAGLIQSILSQTERVRGKDKIYFLRIPEEPPFPCAESYDPCSGFRLNLVSGRQMASKNKGTTLWYRCAFLPVSITEVS